MLAGKTTQEHEELLHMTNEKKMGGVKSYLYITVHTDP